MALNEDVQQVQPRSMDEIERRASRITRHESRLFPRRAVVPSPEATAARITVFMVFPKHETRDTNHGFPAFGTEALQSCFCRPGLPSMTTGRLEIALPSPLGARTKEKSLPASHPCPREEKSEEKNRGGDITPMRLRRSLFFVAPATAAGRPSRRTPSETVQALPGRPGRGGCGLPAAQSMLPCSLLPRIARNCPELLGGWGGPEPVSAHRPPFSVGLTTSAVSSSSRRPPGCFRCGERKMNPC